MFKLRKKKSIQRMSYGAIISGSIMLLWLLVNACTSGGTPLFEVITKSFGIVFIMFIALLILLMGVSSLNSTRTMEDDVYVR